MFQTQYQFSYISSKSLEHNTKYRNSRPKSFEHNAEFRNSRAKGFKHNTKFRETCPKSFKQCQISYLSYKTFQTQYQIP